MLYVETEVRSLTMIEKKVPTKEGLERAKRGFKEIITKKPSDKLISIIEKVTHDNEKVEGPSRKKPDVAAKDEDINPDHGV